MENRAILKELKDTKVVNPNHTSLLWFLQKPLVLEKGTRCGVIGRTE